MKWGFRFENFWTLWHLRSLSATLLYAWKIHSECHRHNSGMRNMSELLTRSSYGNIACHADYPHKLLVITWIGICFVNRLQYTPRNMHTVFALLCFVVVIHWLIFPYPSGLLHWHCGNLTIAPVPAKQPWWIWINTSCEFIMNDCITTTKQSTTKPCAYFLAYTVNIRITVPEVGFKGRDR